MTKTDRTIIILLLVFALVVRLSTLMMIHTGVDERDYWFSAKEITLGLPYQPIQHRTVRWSIILPVAAIQLLLGTGPNIYYVAPLLVTLIITALIYMLGARLSGRSAGLLSALFFVFFPYMIRGGSQIRPGIFSLLYVLLALAALFRYLEQKGSSTRSLLVAGGTLFLAYLSKITNVYFVPGFIIGILLFGLRSKEGKLPWKDLIVFMTPLVTFFVIETAVYAAVLRQPLGRLGIIMTNHLASDYVEPMGFWDLFRRYSPEKLPPYWMIPLITFVPASVLLHRWRRDARMDTLSIAVLCFLLGITFMVSSIHPIVPVEAFIHRYFLAALGAIILLDTFFVLEIVARGAQRYPQVMRLFRRLRNGIPLLPGIGVALAVMILGMETIFASGFLPDSVSRYYTNPLELSQHPIALNTSYQRLVNESYQTGIPLVARSGISGDNALKTCTHFYLDTGFMDSGQPPQPANSQVNSVGMLYLINDSSSSASNRWQESPQARVVLAERNPFRVTQVTLQNALESMKVPESPEDE